MNSLTQHIPSFVDFREEPPVWEFDTTDDLLKLERVKKWAESPGFDYFAVNKNYLMAILDNGFSWWVVGFLKESVNLPKWQGWKFKAEFPDGTQRIVDYEVVSCCGGELTLRDGTKVKELPYKET